NTTTNTHYTYGLPVASLNQQNTFSIFAKDAGRRYIAIYFIDQATQGNQGSIHVDLVNGTVTINPATIGAATNPSGGIISIGGGSYRVWISCTLQTSTTPGNTFCRVFLEQSPAVSNYLGTGLGVYLWGPQLQLGSLTDYVSNDATTPMLPPPGSPGTSS